MLGGLAAEARALEDLDLDPVALLDGLPGLVGLREQDVGVEREDPRVGRRAQDQVQHDGGLLLEGAGHDEPRVEALDRVLEHALGVQVLEVGCHLSGSHSHKCTEPDRLSTIMA